MPNRIQANASLWDQVWEEYDRRQRSMPALQAAGPPARPRPKAAWGRRLRMAVAAGIVASATAYALMPLLAAARMGEALVAGNAGTLAMAVDWTSLPEGIDRAMGESIEQHSGAAAAFLTGMAGEVRGALATPEGLLAVLRDRLPIGQPVNGLGMIGAIQPLDGRRLRVGLHAPGDGREAVTITLALHDLLRLRWQVVGLELPPPLRDDGL